MRIAIWASSSLALLALLAAGPALGAGIPAQLSHQGVLTDTDGVAVPDGLYTLDFDLYDAASNGNHLFGQQLHVNTVGGIYNVLLSDNPSSPGTLKQAFEINPTTYLQVTITDVPPGSGITPGQVLAPRQKLASVPYAFVAATSEGTPEAGSHVLVGQHEANGDSEVVLLLPLGFDRFEIDLVDVLPGSTPRVDLWLQVSTDGGASWHEGASDYRWSVRSNNFAAQNPNGSNGGDQKLLLNYPNHNNYSLDSDKPEAAYNSRILIQNPGGGSGFFTLSFTAAYYLAGNDLNTHGTGVRTSSARVDALRFRMSTGNIQSGKFNVYGLR